MGTISKIDLSSVRFLVVDDNEYMCRLLKEILSSFGAGIVYEAATVSKAMDIVHTDPPDIILSDWMMRPLDGLAFLKTVRNVQGPYIPVVMITGHATGDHVAAAMGEGADSYIVKPFSASTLLEHIVKVIQASQGATYL